MTTRLLGIDPGSRRTGLGVIDVGSNTVHLLVVDAHWGAQPLPATSHKIDLRLSEHTTPDGDISPEGADRLVAFVHECRELADDLGIEQLMGFVTSAIRVAASGFVSRANGTSSKCA